MKLYLKAITALIVTVVTYGFVAPTLISSSDDINVILGLGVCVTVPVIIYQLFKKEISIVLKA
jgi:F0F1-type ATP synthase membrane subunit a